MKEKPNICFLTYSDLPYDQRMLRIWQTLDRDGYGIQIICRNMTGIQNLELTYEIKRFAPLFRKSWLAYAEYNLRTFIRLMRKRPGIVSSVDLDTLPAAILYKRLIGCTLFFDAHEYYTELPELVRFPIKKRIWEWLAWKCIPAVDYSYTVSPGYAHLLHDRYGVHFEVIRNVPFESYQAKNSHMVFGPVKSIIYQGVLNEGRGLETLILAIKDIDGVHLTLIGKGDKELLLKKLVIELKLSEKVTFKGYVLPEELRVITRSAWLGVNILANMGLSYYHSLANKFFDYIQAGVVQLCIDFPEYRRLNDQFQIAHLIPDIEVESIRNGLLHLLNNEDAYQSLRSNIAAAAHELTWEKESEKLLSIYKNIL